MIATVHASSITDAETAVAAVAPEAGMEVWCEVRLDALWTGPPDVDEATDALTRLLAAARVPLLATLRPVRQQGAFDGPEEVRLGLLESAARAGFHAIDVENDLQAMAPLLHHLSKATRRIVLSNHLDALPDRDLGSRHLTAMQDLGARMHKLAFPSQQHPARLRALELARLHASRRGRPALAPVGSDAATRALLALAGNHATYGGSSAPAPDQPGLSDVHAVWDHWGLGPEDLCDGSPRPWYAVLGDPVAHSLSPRMHNAALRAAGDDARFGAMQVPSLPGMLRLTLAVADRIGLRGASVTAPLKEELAAVALPDEVARAVGAANCVRLEEQGPKCTNTDALALRRLLAQAGGDVLVLGSGGAARAAAWAARENKLGLAVAAREPEKAARLAHAFGGDVVAWGDRHEHRDIVVQCTPADVWEGPAPRRAVELVYGTPTRLATVTPPEDLVDGKRFLLEQGVDAYRYWTGRDPDRDVMAAALGL